jgi:hypothetical protein
MAKKESGYLVYVKEGDELPEVFPEIVPFESEFGKLRKEAERLAAEIGLKDDTWDFCQGDERYLVLSSWGGMEAWLADSFFDYQDDYYVYDRVGERWTDDFTWEKRDEAVMNSEDAMLLLSFRMMERFGRFDEDNLEEMKVFAKKWKIPFSAELFGQFDEMFNGQYPYWNSSSAKC